MGGSSAGRAAGCYPAGRRFDPCPPSLSHQIDPEKKRAYERAYMREYLKTENGQRRRRNTTLKHKYGITLEDYERIWTAQDGRCAICAVAFDTVADGHVDHNHATSVVRGLLCGHCNKALGLMRDDSDTLRSAVEYLSRNQP